MDETLRALREQVTAVDRAILDAANERLRLVARIRAHKAEQGIEFLDPERERQLLDELQRANGGPLSADGVRRLHAAVLELTKRELAAE